MTEVPPPRVKHHFFVCTNRRPADSHLPSCVPQGGEAVYQAFLTELSQRGYPPGVKVTATGCLTPCQCGPNVVVYPQGVWYGRVTPEDTQEIIAAHVDEGRVLDRLRLPDDVQVA